MATAKSPPTGDTGASNVLTQYIVGNIKGLQQAYAQAGKLAKQFEHTMAGPMESVHGGFERLGETLKEWIVPLAAAATAWMGFHEVMESFERAEVLKNTAADLGVTVDQLSKLHYAASVSGESADGMDKALRKMSMFLQEATDSSSAAAKQLDQLGLTTKDFAGLSADEALGKFADALKDTQTAGERAAATQAIFGREARKMGGIIENGSAGLKDLGDEGDRLGRTLKAVDVAKLIEAKESMAKLATAVSSLADRVALALGPVFEMVANYINEWIGNTEDFDATFQSVAKGVVVAIGLIISAWQGLELIWDGAKVILQAVWVFFLDGVNDTVKAIIYLGAKAKETWDWIAASFDVTVKTMKVAWEWVTGKIQGGIDYIRESFGKMMLEMGLAATRSGVKGLIEMGDKLAEAGKDLIVAAENSKKGTDATLTKSKDDLNKSVTALEDARAAFDKPVDTSTGWLDNLAKSSKKVLGDFKTDFDKTLDAIQSQKGGNAVTDLLDRFSKSVDDTQKKATELAAKGAEARAVIQEDEYKQYGDYLDGRKKRFDDYAFGLWKSQQDSAEKAEMVQTNEAALNASIIAKMEADAVEFDATRISRDAAFHDSILKAAKTSGELLENIQKRTQKDIEAQQQDFNNNRDIAEKDAMDKQIMLWNSGWRGKVESMQGIMSDLESLMNSKYKSLFEIGKIAAIANTVVNTIESAMNNYKFGSAIGGPVLGGVFAGIAVLAGMVRIQQLQATKFGGGAGSIGGGAGGAGGTSGAAYARGAATANSQQQMNVTLIGDSFSSNQVRGLVGQINSVAGDNLSIATKDEGAS